VAFEQVSIFGLGLIGTSLGLALKKASSPPRVVGFDTSGEALHRAARAGAIDRSAGTLSDACGDSDVVVLAAPVRGILQLLPEIAPHLISDTLVTDTGGTKQEIVRVADSTLPRNAPFVGGHPLAGRLTAGVTQPSPGLFSGVVYCLTPSPNAAAWAVQAAVGLVESVGAQPYFLEAGEHDGLLAAISHLPYFVSVALVNALAGQSAWAEMGSMAAGGFRAASSLAEGDPQMWADVAATNRENLTRQLDMLVSRLTALRDLVARGDDALVHHLQEAQTAHQAWLAQRGDAAPATSSTPAPRGGGWMGRFRQG
jgi:prephenate dehydrogenase